jgi:hypothetical protein
MLEDDEAQQSRVGKGLFDKGKSLMMTATRQYARKQLKWIRQRFLRQSGRQCSSVYGVDSTNPSLWQTHVYKPAEEIITAYVEGRPILNHQPLPMIARAYSFEESREMFKCDVCGIDVKGKLQFDAHKSSRRCRQDKRRRQTLAQSKSCSTEPHINKIMALTLRTEKELLREERMAVLKIVREASDLPLHAIKSLLTNVGEEHIMENFPLDNSLVKMKTRLLAYGVQANFRPK